MLSIIFQFDLRKIYFKVGLQRELPSTGSLLKRLLMVGAELGRSQGLGTPSLSVLWVPVTQAPRTSVTAFPDSLAGSQVGSENCQCLRLYSQGMLMLHAEANPAEPKSLTKGR